MSGLTTGEENVIVFVPVDEPFRKIASRTVLGESVDVPPIKELFGAQIVVFAVVAAESTSPL